MSRITRLPPELLLDILELSDTPSIHATVCWVFNRIATPILYRTVYLYRRYKLVRKPHNIHLFLRTIIGRPALGTFVRRLVEGPFYETSDYPVPPSFVAEAAARGLSPEIQEAVADGSIPAMLFLLLCYLPSLQNLEIRVLRPAEDYRIFNWQTFTTNPIPSALRSIHSAQICLWNTSLHVAHVPWEMIAPFFHLPSLRRFECNGGLVCIDSSNFISNSLPRSTLIEYMIFNDSAVYNIEALVRSSSSLRTFVYNFNSATSVSFHPPAVGNVLRQCALNTLEYLEVNTPDLLVHSLGPLSDFVNLTYIETSLSILLGARVRGSPDAIAHQLSTTLPVSLLSLVLFIDYAWQGVIIVPMMEQFVKHKRERLKHLQEISMYGPTESEMEMIDSLCDAEGLEFYPYHF